MGDNHGPAEIVYCRLLLNCGIKFHKHFLGHCAHWNVKRNVTEFKCVSEKDKDLLFLDLNY